MRPHQIRPLAVCLFRHQGRILVAEGRDPVKGETFYRPLGGGIEFGEYAPQTIAREMREELGAEVSELRYVCALENVFVYNGAPGHEIVLIYDGQLAGPEWYTREFIWGREDNGAVFRAVWKPLSDFGPGGQILYPTGLWEALAGRTPE